MSPNLMERRRTPTISVVSTTLGLSEVWLRVLPFGKVSFGSIGVSKISPVFYLHGVLGDIRIPIEIACTIPAEQRLAIFGNFFDPV
jgi:hypothetical protein